MSHAGFPSPLQVSYPSNAPPLPFRQGASVDALTFADVTPLHVACKLGDRRLVALLVTHGADPRRQSVERQPTAGSGTESGEDEPAEREGAEEEEEERLDAFRYAEMAGDPTVRGVSFRHLFR